MAASHKKYLVTSDYCLVPKSLAERIGLWMPIGFEVTMHFQAGT